MGRGQSPVVEREVRYAVSDGVHIAYTVVGDDPVDVVYTSGIWSNLDVMWEERRWARFLHRLAAFCRLIVFDMRGVGLSDRGSEPPFLESQMGDMSAVMAAAGGQSAVIFGGARGGGEDVERPGLSARQVRAGPAGVLRPLRLGDGDRGEPRPARTWWPG